MQTIVTSELALEPLVVAHAEAMFDVLSDARIYRYLDYPPPSSVEHLRNVYAQLEARKSPDESEIWLNWVVRPHGHPLVGYVQATVASNRSAYVAYIFASKHWGCGYAQKAMQPMLEHLATEYSVDQSLATVEVENRRSIRLLERLGFRPAGARESQGRDLTPTERLYARRITKGTGLSWEQVGWHERGSH